MMCITMCEAACQCIMAFWGPVSKEWRPLRGCVLQQDFRRTIYFFSSCIAVHHGVGLEEFTGDWLIVQNVPIVLPLDDADYGCTDLGACRCSQTV